MKPTQLIFLHPNVMRLKIVLLLIFRGLRNFVIVGLRNAWTNATKKSKYPFLGTF